MLRLHILCLGIRLSNKVRVSASLDKELLKWLDKQIKNKKFANRSHGIEYCIQTAINLEKG